MSDLSKLSDQEQIDAVKKWWKENGISVVVGLVLGVGGIVGYQMWNEYTIKQKRQISSVYTEALSDSVKAEAFFNDGNDGVYALNLALADAAKAVQANDLDKAKKRLHWAIKHANSKAYKIMAIMNLTKIFIAEMDAQKARDTINQIDDYESFKGQASMIKGDVFKLEGRIKQAKSAYQEAILHIEPNSSLSRVIQLKINNL